MKKNKYPRLMIAGVKSGSGKTTLTCALLKALKNRNLNLTSFKCGPDYIDPMFHSEVIGINSIKLSSLMNKCSADFRSKLLYYLVIILLDGIFMPYVFLIYL